MREPGHSERRPIEGFSARSRGRQQLFRFRNALFLLCLLVPVIVQAEDFLRLDEAIPGQFVADLAPVFDFDTDGCLPSSGISRQGEQNDGLNNTGTITGDCRPDNFMKFSNTLHRHACVSSSDGFQYCGHFFPLYFEKDQTVDYVDAGGHRHDWEYAAIWTKNGAITHGSASAHGSLETRPVSELPMENGHTMIVYHKDGPSTHAFRFASPDEVAENPEGKFVTPVLASWNNLTGEDISNQGMRDRLNNFDYGTATLPITRSEFYKNLNEFKPAGYPTFVDKEDCYFTDNLSEEAPAERVCQAGYVVAGLKCSGSYCDNKKLQCCVVPQLELSGSLTFTYDFSEEQPSSYMNDGQAVVGMRCKGSYCDSISLGVLNAKGGKGGTWTGSVSDEQEDGGCSVGGYVAGMKCEGRYCDNISFYCKE